MYPRNAASPERIAVGAVYLIADGTPQDTSVLVRVMPQGGAAAAGGGTLSVDATSHIWHYIPTQAETNYASFMVMIYKASCTSACVTVVTTASSVPGNVQLAASQPGYAPSKAGDAMTLSAGAITDASLAGNMEIVFETDFATNYNQTRNAWATNAQDFVGTTAADPFNGQVVAASVTGAVGSVTAGVTLAAGAVTDASLAGNMEIVFETDFATNYNVTRNAWVTNAQDFVGTTAADPFNGQVVSASVTGAVGSVTGAVGSVTGSVGSVTGAVGSVTAGVTLAAGAITDASLAGNMEIVFETDFATNYNTTRNAWATNVQDFVGTSAADPFNGQVVAASVTGAVGSVTGNVGGNVTGTVTLANGAHGGAAASITLADYSDFTGAAAANPNVLQSGTITVTDQTNFTLNAGSADDDAYLNMVIVLEDAATATQKSVRTITAYVGATKTVTIDSAPDFTIVTTDKFDILAVAPGSTPPTANQIADQVWLEAIADHSGTAGSTAAAVADVLADTNELQTNQGNWLTATGFATSAALATAQADLDTITGTDGVTLATAQALYAPAKAGDAMTITNLTVQASTTLATGTHNPQTGDSYAIVNGVGGISDINTDVEAILADTGTDGVVIAAGQTVATVTDLTNLPTIPANWLTAAGTAADFTTEIQSGLATSAELADGTVQVGTIQDGAIGAAAVADIFSTTTIAEAYTLDAADGTPAQLLYEILQSLTEFSIVGTTLTVKQRDGSTATTYTLDSDTVPTLRNRTS